jgi:hypothetical protein
MPQDVTQGQMVNLKGGVMHTYHEDVSSSDLKRLPMGFAVPK